MSLERTHESQLVQQIQEKHKVRDEMKGILNQSAQDELAHKQQMDEYVSWQRQEERRKRDLYRQMLDTQIAYSNQMKAYGNMTHIEKQLNKPDLKVVFARSLIALAGLQALRQQSVRAAAARHGEREVQGQPAACSPLR